MALELVAVGCSWGGLSAVGRLLDALPPAYEPAVVIVQHRMEHRSPLADLLATTGRPVVEPGDKQPLSPSCTYVAPAGYHLLVDRTGFSLTTEGPVRYSRPSVDVLFESAAEAFGEHLAAVVLTGANEDGKARGLRRVADLDGLALVQDPTTAERTEMPIAAIEAVPEAIVGDLQQLAKVLQEASSPS